MTIKLNAAACTLKVSPVRWDGRELSTPTTFAGQGRCPCGRETHAFVVSGHDMDGNLRRVQRLTCFVCGRTLFSAPI